MSRYDDLLKPEQVRPMTLRESVIWALSLALAAGALVAVIVLVRP